jgi:hypothetical protein
VRWYLSGVYGNYHKARQDLDSRFGASRNAEYYAQLAADQDEFANELETSPSDHSSVVYPNGAVPEAQAFIAAARAAATSARAVSTHLQGTQLPAAIVSQYNAAQQAVQGTQDALQVKLNALAG